MIYNKDNYIFLYNEMIMHKITKEISLIVDYDDNGVILENGKQIEGQELYDDYFLLSPVTKDEDIRISDLNPKYKYSFPSCVDKKDVVIYFNKDNNTWNIEPDKHDKEEVLNLTDYLVSCKFKKLN